MTVHNHQVLTLLKPPLVRLIKDVTDHRVLRLQRDMMDKGKTTNKKRKESDSPTQSPKSKRKLPTRSLA
ncbi:hypothetical protein F2Q69_00053913 [Brassica cretica]|uniref:Uncharacterized protein n=1 Tax=Brassica cretica TaxID=69181 RepID=A0A8S9N520_BRACR|nr:hypothetical protein F2Q69_00053913 [Brassica cretica]